MIFTNTKGKIVGHTENGSYYTIRKPQHFFRKFNGFAISESILNKLKELGIVEIVIRYEGIKGTKILKSPISSWLFDSESYDFEDDRQKVLSITLMGEN